MTEIVNGVDYTINMMTITIKDCKYIMIKNGASRVTLKIVASL